MAIFGIQLSIFFDIFTFIFNPWIFAKQKALLVWLRGNYVAIPKMKDVVQGVHIHSWHETHATVTILHKCDARVVILDVTYSFTIPASTYSGPTQLLSMLELFDYGLRSFLKPMCLPKIHRFELVSGPTVSNLSLARVLSVQNECNTQCRIQTSRRGHQAALLPRRHWQASYFNAPV